MADADNSKTQGLRNWGLICFFLGITSIITSVFLVGIILGLAGVILAVIHLRRPLANKTWLWWGFGVSLAGTFLGVGIAALYIFLFATLKDTLTMEQKPVQDIPGKAIDNLATLAPQYDLIPVWGTVSTQVRYLTSGDWDGDGKTDILILKKEGVVSILSDKKEEKGTIKIGKDDSIIEMGHPSPGTSFLAAYSVWGNNVNVYDLQGKPIWSYPASQGVNGAHWGDINGDGNDELVVGMNGLGGIHALNGQGKLLWKYTMVGNVWNHAVISATSAQPCRVVASEASGSIWLFNERGLPQYKMNPLQGYTAPVDAADIDGQGTLQIVAQIKNFSDNVVIAALDANRKILWKYDVREENSSWRSSIFSHGDWDGDGIQDWAFKIHPYRLIIVSGKGNVLGELTLTDENAQTVLMTRKGEKGLLLVSQGENLSAYEPGVKTTSGETVDKSTTRRESSSEPPAGTGHTPVPAS